MTSRGGSRVRGVLVIAELALAVMLLAGAGLLMRSFVKLQAVDPGFKPEQALTFELTLPDSRYKEDRHASRSSTSCCHGCARCPGFVRHRLLWGCRSADSSSSSRSKSPAGRRVPPAQQPAMQVRVATPDYFSAIGIPLKRGRGFTEDDSAGTPRVVLITESAARQFFPGEDPIGKTIGSAGAAARASRKRAAKSSASSATSRTPG